MYTPRPPRTPFTPRTRTAAGAGEDDDFYASGRTTAYPPLPSSTSSVTLCEIHSELLSVNADDVADADPEIKRADENALNRFIAAGGVLYPHVQLPKDLLDRDEPPALPSDVPPDWNDLETLDDVDPLNEYQPNDADEFAGDSNGKTTRVSTGAATRLADQPSILKAPPNSSKNASLEKSLVKRKTGDGAGSVFGDAVQGGLEALFAKLSELLGDRATSWMSSTAEFVKAKAQPFQTRLEEAADKYQVASFANSALRFTFQSAANIYDMLPAVLPGKSSQQAGQYYKLLLDRLNSAPVSLQAWHPTLHLIAVLHRSNSTIFLHSLSPRLSAWVPPSCGLSHPWQKNVTAIEWRPMRGGELAVACSTRVVLWKVAPMLASAFAASGAPGQAKPARPTLRLLRVPFMSDLTAIAFHPTGNLLAVGGTASSSGPSDALAIWDLDTGRYTMVGGGLGGGTTQSGLVWSADGMILVQACTGPILRIFETSGWTHSIVRLDSPCVSVAICPDSKTVVYTTAGFPALQTLVLRGTGRTDYIALEDRTLILERRVGKRAGKDVVIGGPIKQFVLDPRGERLAVAFEPFYERSDAPPAPGGELVLLFAVRQRALGVEFAQLGYILGPPGRSSSSSPDENPFASSTRDTPAANPLPASLSFAKQFARVRDLQTISGVMKLRSPTFETTSPVTSSKDRLAMSKPSKLTFKGDSGASSSSKPKKKRKHAETAAADEPLEGWIDAKSLEDVTGPVLLITAVTEPPSILCSSADSSLLTLRKLDPSMSVSNVEPDTVADVFIAKRVDPFRAASVAFKTPTGFHIGCDKFGIVGAEREAVGPTEEWTLVQREDGFALENAYGKFLKADRDAAPRGGGAVRADSESVGFAEVWRIRCQASVRAKKKSKEESKEEDLASLEVETLKARQTWGLGRVKAPTGDLSELKSAKNEGRLNEALLDRRAKLKSDKFCK